MDLFIYIYENDIFKKNELYEQMENDKNFSSSIKGWNLKFDWRRKIVTVTNNDSDAYLLNIFLPAEISYESLKELIDMRKDPEIIDWFRIKRLYECSGTNVPISVEHTYEARQFITWVSRRLNGFNNDWAISKDGWRSLEKLCNYIVYDDIPIVLAEGIKDVKCEIQTLYRELQQNNSIYFIDGFTLTKAGKKRIMETDKSLGDLREKIYHMHNPSKIKVRYIANLETKDFVNNKVYDVIFVASGWYKIKTELNEEHLFPPELFEVIEP